MEIRPLQVEDLGAVAAIHQAAFPDSAFTALGFEAVRRYYGWLQTGPHDAVKLGVFEGDRLVAYCYGGVFRGALGGFLRKNRGYLTLLVLTRPWLIGNEIVRDRLRTALRVLGSRPAPPMAPTERQPVERQRHYGILAIAVDPARQGNGAGKLLMLENERQAIERGFSRMALTVSPENEKAVRFYERLGWERDSADADWHGSMLKWLAPAESVAADGPARP
jgi:ribosomal protein S18 acetylase RimI-like enzyme